jgi:hypothetical protein
MYILLHAAGKWHAKITRLVPPNSNVYSLRQNHALVFSSFGSLGLIPAQILCFHQIFSHLEMLSQNVINQSLPHIYLDSLLWEVKTYFFTKRLKLIW